MIRRISVVLVLAIGMSLASAGAAAQEKVAVVYLKDGSRIVGEIIELIPDQHLKVRSADGREYLFTFDTIDRIAMEQSSTAPRNIRHEKYSELGVVLGTPADFNVIVGHYSGPAGFRFSGMYYGERRAGIQLDVGVKLYATTKWSHALVFLGGIEFTGREGALGSRVIGGPRIEYKHNWNYRYLGIAYNLQYKWFYFQTGPAFRSLSVPNPNPNVIVENSNPVFVGQIGFVYRFMSD